MFESGIPCTKRSRISCRPLYCLNRNKIHILEEFLSKYLREEMRLNVCQKQLQCWYSCRQVCRLIQAIVSRKIILRKYLPFASRPSSTQLCRQQFFQWSLHRALVNFTQFFCEISSDLAHFLEGLFQHLIINDLISPS